MSKPNWIERIEAARTRGAFDDCDRKQAQDWTTCACGSQDRRIPRYTAQDEKAGVQCAWEDGERDEVSRGVPRDAALRVLGTKFYTCIDQNLFTDAALCLLRIERRAGQVLWNEQRKAARSQA